MSHCGTTCCNTLTGSSLWAHVARCPGSCCNPAPVVVAARYVLRDFTDQTMLCILRTGGHLKFLQTNRGYLALLLLLCSWLAREVYTAARQALAARRQGFEHAAKGRELLGLRARSAF